MKSFQQMMQFAGAVGIISVVTSPAAAGTCETNFGNFTSDNPNGVLITCKHDNASVSRASAFVSTNGSNKTININYLSGPSGMVAQIIGLDSSLQPIAGCTISDDSPDGNPESIGCNAAVFWRGTVTYQE